MAIVVGAAQSEASAPGAGSARPTSQLHTYFSTDDYPMGALLRRAQGTVHFSLRIDREGAPSRCTVTESSGDPDLDRVTCEILMSRARFSPARDAQGRAVEDRVSSRVRWILPEDTLRGLPFAPIRSITAITASPAGVTCQTTIGGLEAPGFSRAAPCPRWPAADGALIERVLSPGEVMTIVLEIAPLGSPHPIESELGELRAESAARFSLADDGGVLECRSTRRQLHGPPSLIHEAPDMCRLPMLQGRVFEVAQQESAPRLGRIEMRIYVRNRGDVRTR